MIYCFEKTAGLTFFAADASFQDKPLRIIAWSCHVPIVRSEGFMARGLYTRSSLLRTATALYCFGKTSALTFFAADAIFEDRPLELLHGTFTYR